MPKNTTNTSTPKVKATKIKTKTKAQLIAEHAAEKERLIGQHAEEKDRLETIIARQAEDKTNPVAGRNRTINSLISTVAAVIDSDPGMFKTFSISNFADGQMSLCFSMKEDS